MFYKKNSQLIIATSIDLTTTLDSNFRPSGTINLKSNNIQEFIAKLQLKGININTKKLQFASNFNTYEKAFSLTNINLTTDASNLNGSISLTQNQGITTSKFDLKTANLHKLGKVTDVQLPQSLSSIQIKGTIEGNMDKLQVNITADLANSSISLNGSILSPKTNIRYQGYAKITSNNLDQLITTLTGQTSQTNIKRLNAEAQISGDRHYIKLTSIKTTLKGVPISGNSEIHFRPILKIKANFHVSEFNFKNFAGGSKSRSLKKYSTPPTKQTSKRLHAVTKPKASVWSYKPFDFSGPKKLDAEISLSANEIIMDNIVLTNAKTFISIKNGTITIANFAAGIFGGSITGSGELVAANISKVKAKINLKNIDLKSLSQTAANFDKIQGKLNFNMNAVAQGKSPYGLITNLHGQGSFATKNAKFKGIDLRKVTTHLRGLGSISGFVGLFTAVATSGTTDIEKFSGNFNIRNGIITPENTVFIAEGVSATIGGNINLPTWRYNLSGKAEFVGAKGLPKLGFSVKGPIDNPKTSLDKGALKAYIAHRTIGTVKGIVTNVITKGGTAGGIAGPVGGIIGGLLGGVLPKGKTKQKTTTDSTTSEPSTTQKESKPPSGIIGGVIGGLLGSN